MGGPALNDFQGRKTRVVEMADALAPEWRALALQIHANPELGLQERKASGWLADALMRHGFHVERNVGGLETAFVARAAKSAAKPRIAFLAEYDALPEMGHACGHNLIGPASCLAAVALAKAEAAAGAGVMVIGCPAEEFYGGKARLLEAGVFAGVDAALMAHGYYLNLAARPTIGRASLIFEFFGRPAHASTVPEQGINALDAVIQTFNNIGLLRQQLRSEARIHGIITHGGRAANVIPDYTRAEFYVRSASIAYLEELKTRVTACAQAAALATGARLEVSSEGHLFLPQRLNATLSAAYEDNVRFIGERVDPLPAEAGYGSTDFGNVSQAIPAVHGYFRITDEALRPHSLPFAAACRSERALGGLVSAAKTMALTGLDLILQPELLAAAKQELDPRVREEAVHG